MKNDVWLITGSTRGLGRALAEAVLAAGHNLVATGRNPEKLKDLVARYGEQVRAIALDVTSEQAAASAIAETRRAFGRLDVVANNADFAGSSTTIREGRPEYDPTVGKIARFQRDYNGKQPGDPARAAAAVLRITSIDNPPLRLILGSDAFQAIEQNDVARLNSDRQW